MSAFDYGPSLSDQGYSIDDIYVGDCCDCGRSLDRGDMRGGWGVEMERGGVWELRCKECAQEPGRWHVCQNCGDVTDERCPCTDEEGPF